MQELNKKLHWAGLVVPQVENNIIDMHASYIYIYIYIYVLPEVSGGAWLGYTVT